MNAVIFKRQLALWTLRGTACAMPSAFWAIVNGFNSGREVAALAAGVATVILIYAVATTRLGLHAPHAPGSFSRALSIAANLRTALALIGVAGIVVPPLGLLTIVDLWTGMASISFIGWITRHAGGVFGSTGDSFGLTYATTLVQAAMVSLGLGLLTALIWGAWRGAARIRVALSPSRANVGSDGIV